MLILGSQSQDTSLLGKSQQAILFHLFLFVLCMHYNHCYSYIYSTGISRILNETRVYNYILGSAVVFEIP